MTVTTLIYTLGFDHVYWGFIISTLGVFAALVKRVGYLFPYIND